MGLFENPSTRRTNRNDQSLRTNLWQLYTETLGQEQTWRAQVERYYRQRITGRRLNISENDEDRLKIRSSMQKKEAEKAKYNARYPIIIFKSGEAFPSVFEKEAVYARIDCKRRGLLCTFRNYHDKIGKDIFVQLKLHGENPETLEEGEFEEIVFRALKEDYLEFQLYVFRRLVKPLPAGVPIQEKENKAFGEEYTIDLLQPNAFFPEVFADKVVYIKADPKEHRLLCRFNEKVQNQTERAEAIIEADPAWLNEKKSKTLKTSNSINSIEALYKRIRLQFQAWRNEKEPATLEMHEFEQAVFQVYDKKRLEFQKYVFDNLEKEKSQKEPIYLPRFWLRDLKDCQQKIRALETAILQDKRDLAQAEAERVEHVEKLALHEARFRQFQAGSLELAPELIKFQEQLTALAQIKMGLERRLRIQPAPTISASAAPATAAVVSANSQSAEGPSLVSASALPQPVVAPLCVQAEESRPSRLSQNGRTISAVFFEDAGNLPNQGLFARDSRPKLRRAVSLSSLSR